SLANDRVPGRLECLGRAAVPRAGEISVHLLDFPAGPPALGHLNVGPHAGVVLAVEEQRLFDQAAVPALGAQRDPKIPVVLAVELVPETAGLHPRFAAEHGAGGNVVVEQRLLEAEALRLPNLLLRAEHFHPRVAERVLRMVLEYPDGFFHVGRIDAIVGIERYDVFAASERRAFVAGGGESLVLLVRDAET